MAPPPSLPARPRALLVLVTLLGSGVAGAGLPPADVLIRGGTVYDGSDAAPVSADVVIADDRVVYVGADAARRFKAHRLVDANGRIVAPGFIDAHTHPDTYIRAQDPRARLNAPWLFQGVATVVIGVDGGGTPDVAADSAAFARAGVGTNLVPYVGFGAVRERALGNADRAPSAPELEAMRAAVARAMCEGAVGLSTGLFYAPQSYATTAEVTVLAREAARRGGIFDTHQRDESSYGIGLLASVEEVLQIGREASIPVNFAHIKALGVDVQGKSGEVIALIDAARAAGQDVSADQYPWDASGSSLEAALVPHWALADGHAALLQRLEDPVQAAKIRAEMQDNLRRRGGATSLLLTTAGTPWIGRTLSEMASRWQVDPLAAAVRIIRSGVDRGDVVSFNMVEADIRRFMREPWVMTSSDGSDGHPRQYATFPRKYRKYVRDEHVISLTEFVRSSTGRTADRFQLEGRGYLRAGSYADVVVIDPERYAPRADYVHPRRLARGVEQLWVNGRAVIRDGHLTGAAPGRVLLHTPPAGTCP